MLNYWLFGLNVSIYMYYRQIEKYWEKNINDIDFGVLLQLYFISK